MTYVSRTILSGIGLVTFPHPQLFELFFSLIAMRFWSVIFLKNLKWIFQSVKYHFNYASSLIAVFDKPVRDGIAIDSMMTKMWTTVWKFSLHQCRRWIWDNGSKRCPTISHDFNFPLFSPQKYLKISGWNSDKENWKTIILMIIDVMLWGFSIKIILYEIITDNIRASAWIMSILILRHTIKDQ